MQISNKKLQEIVGFKPHEGQSKLIETEAREFVAVCGRRWGKSNACAYKALRQLLIPNQKVWIVAPTYDLSQKVFHYLIRFLAKIDPQGKMFKISRRPFPKIDGTAANGSLLECKSTENPKSLLGEEVDLEIVDEAPLIPENIYQAYIVPVTSSRLGRIVFIGTPRGKDWFYQKFLSVGELNRIQQESMIGLTTVLGKERAIGEWERLQKLLPQDVFNQEYRAQFIDGVLSVFKDSHIQRIINSAALKDCVNGHYYVMGVDLAKVQDYTVITVIDTYTNTVVYLEITGREDYPFQKARIKSVAQRYNNARIVIDSTGVGEPIYDDLAAEGLMIDDIKFSSLSKELLINKLRIFIEEGNLTIPNDSTLINQLRAFAKEISPSGRINYAAPAGQHDDCVFSLALAAWALTGHKVEPPNILKKELNKARSHKAQSYI